MTTHSYITLKEIYNLFYGGQAIKIVDSANDEDITDGVILQSLALFSTSPKLKRKLVKYAKQDAI